MGQAGRSFTVRANPNDLDCDDKQVQGFLRGEPTTKKSDPAIEVTCDYSNEITCSETMSCTAVIVNTL